jgi:hypothetical protein
MVTILRNDQQKLISIQSAGPLAPNQVCKIAVPQAALRAREDDERS